MERKLISPTHLQFYISDLKISAAEWFGEDPKIISNGLIVTVPCQYWIEGETEVIIGAFEEVPKDGILAFEGWILTQNKVLVISNVEHEHLIEHPVSKEASLLSIWTDGRTYPERVVVGVR